jgi:hypothetical protein
MSLEQENEDRTTQPRRSRPTLWYLWLGVLLLVAIAGLTWLLQPLRAASELPAPPLPSYTPETPDYQEMLVLGPTVFAPQTRGAVRILVRDPRSGQPLPGVEVRISLLAGDPAPAGEVLYRGETNDLGTVEAVFEVPAVKEGQWTLAIDATGPVGEQHLARTVTIRRSLALHVQTPKRTYHPGEPVEAWFWAGGLVDHKPAVDQRVTWTLLDARGNRVCGGAGQTSVYGVAQTACVLAEGAGEGTYRLVAMVGDLTAESELEVQHAVPGTLHVKVQLTQGYAVDGQAMTGQVQVADAYGNRVANASVEVEGRLDRWGEPLFRRVGQTDETGAFTFVVADLQANSVDTTTGIQLVAWADDVQGRSGRDEVTVPVSEQELEIAAWPESTVLRPGLENLVRVTVLYPDGRPARCELEATVPGLEQAVRTETDAEGLAWIPIAAEEGSRLAISLQATGADGAAGSARFDFSLAQGTQQLLLRLERERYTAGEAMQLDALTQAAEAAYLDLSIGGQQVAAYAAPVVGGRARFQVPLQADWAGAVELDAYALLPDGTLLRDARLVQVMPSPSLQVRARRLEDGPGLPATARVALQTTVNGGAGTPALVIASVTRPGDEGSADGSSSVRQSMPRSMPAVELVPQYAETLSKLRPISASVLQAFESYDEAWALRRGAFTAAAEWISWGTRGLFLLSWLIVLVRLWQRGSSPLPTILGSLFAGPLLIGMGVLGIYLGVISMGPGATLALGLAWLGALLAAVVQVRAGREARWMTAFGVLAAAGGVLAVALHYAVARSAGADPGLGLYAWVALGGMCLALSASGLGCLRDGKPQQAWATFSLVLVLAATVGGTALAGWDQRGPTYQELPPLRPRVDPPAPLPIQSETPLVMAADVPTLPFVAPAEGRELLAWVPGAETDQDGSAVIQAPLVEGTDNARLTTLALDADGRWGGEEVMLPLSKPLWATVELPSELTVGDQLALPVTVHNALPISSSVQISVTEGAWFVVRPASDALQQTTLPPAGEHTFALPIRVDNWGDQDLVLSIESQDWSEVITRTVSVRPDGDWVAGAYSWWVEEEDGYKFRIPWAAYEDTDRIAVRVYTGQQSVLSEALARASEQGGSTLDQLASGVEARLAYAAYLQRTGQGSGSIRSDLERALELDYQRLLAFEAMGGGFAVLPGAKPDLYRSAIALRCLSDLAAVTSAGSEAADRTAAWLLAQQTTDGTWQLEELPPSWAALAQAELPITAHVAWALLDAGYASPGTQVAVQHIREYLDSAQDPYVLALAINALLSAGEGTDELAASLARLAEQAEVRYDLARWQSGLQALSGASGSEISAGGYRTPSIKVEVAALATLALARGGGYPDLVDAGLAMLTDSRDVAGTWNAPAATTLALRAFMVGLPDAAEDQAESPASARVRIAMNEGGAQALTLQGDDSAEVSYTDLEKGYNDVQITVEGSKVAYQIVGTYCLRWSQVPLPLPEEEELSLEINYDRTSVSVGESITVAVGVMLNRPGVAPLVSLELGLPPGLTLAEADMDRLVAEGVIGGYERVGERLHVYLQDLSSEQPVRFSYRLRAGYPLRVLSQPSSGIDAANPQRPAVRAPVQVQVQ